MTSTETTGRRMEDAERPLWVGQTPPAWCDVVRSVDPEEAHDAASMIAAAGLDWGVGQHPLGGVAPPAGGRRGGRVPGAARTRAAPRGERAQRRARGARRGRRGLRAAPE